MIAANKQQALAMWQGYKQSNANGTVENFLSMARQGQLNNDMYSYENMVDSWMKAERTRLGLDYLPDTHARIGDESGTYTGMDYVRYKTA